MTFDEAFQLLLFEEGDYSNNPVDPGGETRWGVTKRVARRYGYEGEMRDLPQETAKEIAKKEYWDCVRADELPPYLRYPMFDAAYNSGPTRSVEWLQQALGLEEDGTLGSLTMAGALMSGPELVSVLEGYRLEFLTDLHTWPTFSRGWAKRIARILKRGKT